MKIPEWLLCMFVPHVVSRVLREDQKNRTVWVCGRCGMEEWTENAMIRPLGWVER